MCQVVMLAQFLWNWVKQSSNVGPEKVHITNFSASTVLVLLLVHIKRRKKNQKNFKRLTNSSVSPIWAIKAGAGVFLALIS